MAAPRFVVSAARTSYRAVLRWHPAAQAGYAPQMQATFDTMIERAAVEGSATVARVAVREAAGLLANRRSGPLDVSVPAPGSPLMRNISQDVRFAVRTFARRPAFTAAVVLTIALGVGANTAILSVTNAVLLQRLPFTDPARLVMIWEDASAIGFPRNTPAPGNYFDWTTAIPAIDGAAALSRTAFNLVGDGDPEVVEAAQATANLFPILGATPELGRVWGPGEDVPGTHVAVLGHALWTRRFHADAGIVNRTITLSGTAYTIIGVMPARFELIDPALQVWTPLGFTAAGRQNRGGHYLEVVGRLAPGATLSLANAQLRALADRLQVEHPETNRGVGMFAVPLLDDYVGDTRTALLTLLAAVGCVLLIACVNVANLLLTHASGRAREMAVRAALGADRRRLIRQLLTESLLLAVAGGGLGVLLATQSFSLLTLLVPPALAGMSHVRLDLRVLVVTGGLSLLTGLTFGLAPAWRASRVEHGLSVTRTSRGVVGSGARLRGGLVVTEIALATAILIAAGLLVQSLRAAQGVPLGFQPANVLTLRLPLPRAAYNDPARRTQFVDTVLDGVRHLPGVTAAGITSALPLTWKGGTGGFVVEGRAVDPSLPYDANNRTVTPGYMEALGYTLRAGRFFDERDAATGAPVGIVNETMARRYWPDLDPIGRQFKFDATNSPWRTIVGVVSDTRVMGIEQPTRAEMYFPVAQSADNWMWPRDLAIHADGDPRALIQAVSRAVRVADPSQPISHVEMMDDIVADELQDRRLQTTLMGVFAGLGLFLAAIGVYGVLSYMVTERTAEIGVRLALGSRPAGIQAWFVARGLWLAGLGLGIGLMAAFWGTALIDRLLFKVAAHDLRTFAVQAVVIAIVCVAAAYLPARRASRIDPIVALRSE